MKKIEESQQNTAQRQPSGRGIAIGLLCCGVCLLAFPKFVGLVSWFANFFYAVGLILFLVGILGICSTTFH